MGLGIDPYFTLEFDDLGKFLRCCKCRELFEEVYLIDNNYYCDNCHNH